MHTLAILDVKAADWILFSLQYAFSSVFFTTLIVLASLVLIFLVFGFLWGRLWNKKWGPFKKPLDCFVCLVISLLFVVTSVSLHGISGLNFGMGIKDIDCATYSAPKKAKLSDKLFRIDLENENGETVTKTPDLLGQDSEKVREHIINTVAKRWASYNGSPLIIRDFLYSILKDDADLTEACEHYASSDAKGWNKARGEFDAWESALNAQNVGSNIIMEVYKETARALVYTWWTLLITMFLYVMLRACRDIKVTPLREFEARDGKASSKPSQKALDWANEADTDENASK